MKRKYSDEEKQAIIKHYISDGESAASILADTGVPKITFYNWLKVDQEKKNSDNRKTVNIHNINLLENKVARLKGIIEILKTAGYTPQMPLKQRLYSAEQLYGKYSVHMICEALDIPRGTFYNHVLRNKKDNTWYAKRREELKIRIQEIYDENNQILGAAKIAAVMRNENIHVSDKIVRSLMHDWIIVNKVDRKKRNYRK